MGEGGRFEFVEAAGTFVFVFRCRLVQIGFVCAEGAIIAIIMIWYVSFFLCVCVHAAGACVVLSRFLIVWCWLCVFFFFLVWILVCIIIARVLLLCVVSLMIWFRWVVALAC